MVGESGRGKEEHATRPPGAGTSFPIVTGKLCAGRSTRDVLVTRIDQLPTPPSTNTSGEVEASEQQARWHVDMVEAIHGALQKFDQEFSEQLGASRSRAWC